MSDIEVLHIEFQFRTAQRTAETHEIERSPNGVTDWVTVGFGDDHEFVDTDLPVGSTWYYRVRSWDAKQGIWSDWSKPVSATTNYTYDIRISPEGEKNWTTVAENVEGYEKIIDDLNGSASYDISIRAFDGTSYSDWSPPVAGIMDTGAADLNWVDPPEHQRVSGIVELVTETTDDRVEFVRYLIGDREIGIVRPRQDEA